MASNQAAWLDEGGKKLRVGSAEMPKPGADDIVIKVAAAAVNPVDCTFPAHFHPSSPATYGSHLRRV